MSSEAQQRKEDVNKLPAPADSEVVGMIAQQGMIGQSLREALQDILADDSESVALDDNSTVHGGRLDDDISELSGSIHQGKKRTPGRNKIELRQHMADSVMKRFGRAVAETQKTSLEESQEAHGRKRKDPPAPAALLRGRIDLYNRLNGKWRIVVEGAQLKQRVGLPKDREKKSRKSLWDAVGIQETVNVPTTLQILAYDDLP